MEEKEDTSGTQLPGNETQGGASEKEQTNGSAAGGGGVKPASNGKAPAGAKEGQPRPKGLKEKAREYFKHNAVDTLHLTADGYGFYAKGDANAHALSLEDKAVTTFNRKDLEPCPHALK